MKKRYLVCDINQTGENIKIFNNLDDAEEYANSLIQEYRSKAELDGYWDEGVNGIFISTVTHSIVSEVLERKPRNIYHYNEGNNWIWGDDNWINFYLKKD
jgi:hypothetical protein